MSLALLFAFLCRGYLLIDVVPRELFVRLRIPDNPAEGAFAPN